jgi:pyruvate,water dikinase
VPIANDLAVMISTGVADKLFKKWLKQDDVYEYLKMSSHASLISLDPGLEILAISEKIKNDTTLSELFIKNDTNKIWLQLENEYKNTKVAEMIFYYLKKFGSRSPNELKLESITLEEDPKIFINCLKKIVSSPNANNLSKKTNIKEQTKSIKNKNISWVKKIVLNIIIKWSVNSIRRREETRFKRTLIFGFARKIFLQMGRLFVKLNLMKSHRDIFYLKTGEIFSIIDQKMSKDDVDKLIQNRKVTIKKWRGIELPRRIETDKTIKEQEQEFLIKTDIEVERTDLFGVIASKAKQSHIDGEALVLTDFDPVADYSNKILVTRQTDPGWSIVFPLIKGLVVERGGMLSHAAIVARELGIPCLIGATNATSLVKDNSKVILNFSTGQISYE